MDKLLEQHEEAIYDAEYEEIKNSAMYRMNFQKAAKECTKISIQYTIDVLKEISGLASEDRQEATINKIEELTKQLNEL